MPLPKDELHRLWKESNELVRVAERHLAAAWAAFAAGEAGPPHKELTDEVTRLRKECDKRLAALLEEFNPSASRTDPDEHPP